MWENAGKTRYQLTCCLPRKHDVVQKAGGEIRNPGKYGVLATPKWQKSSLEPIPVWSRVAPTNSFVGVPGAGPGRPRAHGQTSLPVPPGRQGLRGSALSRTD